MNEPSDSPWTPDASAGRAKDAGPEMAAGDSSSSQDAAARDSSSAPQDVVPDGAREDTSVRDAAADSSSGALAWVATALPDGHIAVNYSAQLRATGGKPPYRWQASGGLAPGLALSESGIVRGVPEQSGEYVLKANITDAAGARVSGETTLKVLYVALLTGFGPWAGHPINTSWEAIKPLDGARYGDYEVRTALIPVEWETGPKELLGQMAKHRPSLVVSSGVADGTQGMRLERYAQNRQEGTDNAGDTKLGSACLAGGPAKYETNLPLSRLVQVLKPSLGGFISDNAGTYLCNQIFYTLMNKVKGTKTAAGFIHVSSNTTRVNIDQITEGWRIVLGELTKEAPLMRPQSDFVEATVHTPPLYR